MSSIVIVPGCIVTGNASGSILRGHFVRVEGNRISEIAPLSGLPSADASPRKHVPSLTLIPGFVQTHIHLCQTLFRGMADDLALLDWLQLRIFPYENAHNPASLRASVQLGINDLLSGGTTTILDMGTMRHQDVVFEELTDSGIRAFAGKCMIDQNTLFPLFKNNTRDELNETRRLAGDWHNTAEGRIMYGFAPRFVLSCSESLLRETAAMVQDFPGSVLHTHASENSKEIEVVREMTGKDNIEYFESIGALSEASVLAHCIHVKPHERAVLKRCSAKVSHCPSSNLKLASGIANIPLYLKEGISVSLGADGAPCNNNLSAFMEMRLAALIQKPVHGPTAMDARTVFRLATMGGAEALRLDHEIGSIEVGKKADLVLLNLERPDYTIPPTDEKIYSDIVYTAQKDAVRFVMADGRWVVEDGIASRYNQEELLAHSRSELSALLDRVN